MRIGERGRGGKIRRPCGWMRPAALSAAVLIAVAPPPAARAQQVGARAADSAAAAPASRCMERHMRDAAKLNRERMPLYAALTEGRSRGISRRLIWAERLSIPVAWYVDRRARPFQRAGIPVVCDDFVPMAETPAFRERIDHPPPLSAFAPSDARRIRRAITRARRDGGFPAVSAAVEHELARLEGTPGFHCMVRHLLESALRIANQAPLYEARARELGLRSPAGVSRMMLDLHLTALAEAAALDRRAAPLQARGIPIVCQDVPPIAPFAGR
ncbi:MAG TPA: hypothetical protein VF006_08115 [Longimicrobium sp.]